MNKSATNGSNHNSATIIFMAWVMYACYGWAILIFSYLSYYIVQKYTDIPSSLDRNYINYLLSKTLITYLVVFMAIILVAASVSSFYLKRNPNVQSRSLRSLSIAHGLIYALIGAVFVDYTSLQFLLVNFNDGISHSSDNMSSLWGTFWMILVISTFTCSLYALSVLRITNYSFKPAWFDKFYYWGIIIIGFILAIVALLAPKYNIFIFFPVH